MDLIRILEKIIDYFNMKKSHINGARNVSIDFK